MTVNLENARYKTCIFRSQPIKILRGKGADRPLQHEVYFHELKILVLRIIYLILERLWLN